MPGLRHGPQLNVVIMMLIMLVCFRYTIRVSEKRNLVFYTSVFSLQWCCILLRLFVLEAFVGKERIGLHMVISGLVLSLRCFGYLFSVATLLVGWICFDVCELGLVWKSVLLLTCWDLLVTG